MKRIEGKNRIIGSMIGRDAISQYFFNNIDKFDVIEEMAENVDWVKKVYKH